MSGPERIVIAALGETEISLDEVMEAARLHRDRRFVELAVADRLVRADAEQAGLDVSDEELQRAADALRRKMRLFTKDDTARWLTENDMSVEDLEALVELDLLRAKLAGRIAQSDIDAHFEANRAAYDRVSLSRLLVGSAELAEELLLQIEEDEADFRLLAMQHGVDPISRFGAGYLGALTISQVQPQPLQAAVAGALTGEVVGPVPVGESFALAKIWGVAKAELDDPLRQKIARALFEQGLARRCAAAKLMAA